MLVVAIAGAAGCAPGSMDDTGTFEQAIIGGEAADPGEYPATGALVRGRSYRCTATLIAPDVALTAAHCLEGDGWGDFGFTLDDDLTRDVTDIIPAMVTHQHPDFHFEGNEYTKIGRRNDVGVVILEEPIFGVGVEKLDVSEEATSLAAGTELFLCGYGRDKWSVATTAGLKRDGSVFVDVATSWELQSIDEDPQPCKGDSGGPLFAETSRGRRIAGLVSRASGDSHMCDTGAIYTRVAPYADWIREASMDRDTGCAVGKRGSSSLATWTFALAALLVTRRRRRGHQLRR